MLILRGNKDEKIIPEKNHIFYGNQYHTYRVRFFHIFKPTFSSIPIHNFVTSRQSFFSGKTGMTEKNEKSLKIASMCLFVSGRYLLLKMFKNRNSGLCSAHAVFEKEKIFLESNNCKKDQSVP